MRSEYIMNEALRRVSGREVLVQVRSYRKIISPLFCKWFDEIVTFPLCKVVIKSIISICKEPVVGPCVLVLLLLSVLLLLLLLLLQSLLCLLLLL